MRRVALLLAMALAGCSGASAGVPVPPGPSRVAVGRAPTPPRQELVETPYGPCRLREDRGGQTIGIACTDPDGARRWGYDEAAHDDRDAVLAADSTHLYVAWFSNVASGCEVVAYELKSGTIAWRNRLVGVGRASARDGANAVELRLASGRLRVLGWESSGQYIEEIDPITGATIASSAIDPEHRDPAPANPIANPPPHPGRAESVKFQFDGTSPRRRSRVSIDLPSGATCSFDFDQEASRSHLACTAHGARTWGIDLAEQFVPSGALAAAGDRLYVVTYCAIASGAVVSAYDAARGRFLWSRPLFALGPVDHSEYYNDLDVRVEGAWVVVSGWEAYGRYVEVLDAATGDDLGQRLEGG
ncbi:MAG: PQQ-binding-like beta-propeller repeat protein [Polyangiaceae bacterium]